MGNEWRGFGEKKAFGNLHEARVILEGGASNITSVVRTVRLATESRASMPGAGRTGLMGAARPPNPASISQYKHGLRFSLIPGTYLGPTQIDSIHQHRERFGSQGHWPPTSSLRRRGGRGSAGEYPSPQKFKPS